MNAKLAKIVRSLSARRENKSPLEQINFAFPGPQTPLLRGASLVLRLLQASNPNRLPHCTKEKAEARVQHGSKPLAA